MNELEILKNLNVLYVEDDIFLRKQIQDTLTFFFKEVHSTDNGERAIKMFDENQIHIVIVDIKMPIMDGLTFAGKLRERRIDVPIFITSSFLDTPDLLEAIKIGVVDYIQKPITYQKLKETLLECARRVEKSGGVMIKINEQVSYNVATRQLISDGESAILSKKEYLLVEFLLRNKNKLVTKKEIENVVYGFDDMSDAAYKNLIFRLKKKLKTERIVNVKDVGYIYKDNDA